MKNPKRTTLLINLSVEEAEQIRAAAKKQDRTISAFVLRAVMNRIRVERALEDKRTQPFFENYVERVRQQRWKSAGVTTASSRQPAHTPRFCG